VQPRHVQVEAGGVTLAGDLSMPKGARGIVLFAHGSGSGRHSPRNRYVATGLQAGNLGTLLIDLLTEDEERVDLLTRHLRFDIEMLAKRLTGAVDWLKTQPETQALPVGLFGASTGAGAALITATHRPDDVHAVVSRGGRPDLAGAALPGVKAPILLIVGGLDEVVIDLNKQAMQALKAETRLEIVPGASHLFEEPGKLEQVVQLARDWFEAHFHQDSSNEHQTRR
jgi:putative phosphoribosyl transferase